jgi:multidrug efflux pump subunit AcrA (membrane-fusion protein)
MGDYRIAKHAADTIELNMQQRTELYELDLAHQKYLLKTLQQNRQYAMITSNMDGELVALTEFGNNRWLSADQPVVAVGDLNKKILKCDYINKNTIKNAQEVYALVDGVKYQVEYEAMSSDEYARQSANGGKVYSTFYLPEGTGDEIQVGDYAVITVISKRYENVLSIPKGSIRKDEMGSFVYLYQDGKSIRANIQTGYSDGTYTEILSGLKEGDKVLYTAAQKLDGSKTVKIGRGEFHTDFPKGRS